MFTKLEAVCRAGWRGERRRCAVRMTATGSVTPWMACGSRPVERAPEPGAFPAVGINQRPGVKGAGPFAPLPPPPTAGWQIAIADQGGTGQVGTGQVGTDQVGTGHLGPPNRQAGRSARIGGMAGRPGPRTCKATLHIPRFTAPARSRIVNVLIKMLWET